QLPRLLIRHDVGGEAHDLDVEHCVLLLCAGASGGNPPPPFLNRVQQYTSRTDASGRPTLVPMSTEPRAGRPKASSRETNAEAACELFLEQGYEQTSVTDVARRAGVSRSS